MSKELGNTNKNHQELLIDYVSGLITEDNMEPRIKESKRSQKHLRAEIRKDPIIYLNQLTNGLFNKELTLSKDDTLKQTVSREFPIYILKTKKAIKIQNVNVPQGTKIYFVNTVHVNDTAKFNTNSKAMTPAKFNFSGSTIKENFLRGKILRAFSSVRSLFDVDFKIEFLCVELVNHIDKRPPKNDEILDFSEIKNLSDKSDRELISEINNSDINVIAKNFGEILGALWYMRIDPEENSVYYPVKENQPVIDYKVHTYNNRVITSTKPISAKSGLGAASSLTGLYYDKKQDLDYNVSTIENTEPSNAEEKKLKDFLVRTKNFKIPQKILSMNEEILKHKKPYSILANNITGEVNPTSINKFLHAIKDYDDASEKLKDFFDSCEYQYEKPESKRILTEIFSRKSGDSRLGAVIYPLGIYAAREMNKNEDYLNFLNKVVKGKKIIQVNIYLTKKDIKFTKNDINDPDSKKSYEFVYNGMARDENNRGMSFKLKG